MEKIVIFMVVCLGSADVALGDDHERRLLRYLLADYDRSVRPSQDAAKPLNVTFGMALTQIIDVDERNQILTTNCWLTQEWIDYSLTWNRSEFGGIPVIRLPHDRLWKPDILLYNNADSAYSNAILSTNIIVKADGNVTWLSSAIFKSSCSINVEFFPFDEQTCTMKFASWTYDGLQVNLLNQTEQGDLSNYVTNGEWDLLNLTVERNVVYYSCCEAPYPDITYRIVLLRRPLFYVFNLILPCVLITGIALMSFYMPSDSGEKVTLGITTLLSMTVFLMVIGESMPPTSEKLPLIGLYYGVTISLVSFATGLSVVTLNIHHRGMRGREVPRVVKRIVFEGLAPVLCIRLDPPSHCLARTKDDYRFCFDECHIESTPVDPELAYDHQLHIYNGGHCGGSRNPSLTETPPRLGAAPPPLGAPPTVHPSLDLFEHQFMRVLNKVYHTIERNDQRLAEQDRRDAIKLEWQQMALVLDRFLLWVFITSTVGATFGILYMSPHTKLFTV
ncbi:neuronal acetylcholine receptor subunit alpha-10-like [Amphibalanus amphitrite]|uniref:neuronal acetylcholine receptor subunit alpha-10-like n=1 Tax=Amphibalanus amphitrite TaxID=1232801 RepID=UPI001C913CBE|nr:neuronal acetylcholine receptor subunit alpha-10-like [Amphibalanus amphitrite]